MADQVMEFEEREEPKFIRFATGDVCEGMLLLIENVKVQGSPAVRYTIRQPNGEEVAFLGTNQINRKLRRGDEGHGVQIACVGEDPKIKKGENCMKLFTVKVSKSRVVGVALPIRIEGDLVPEITDADIPF